MHTSVCWHTVLLEDVSVTVMSRAQHCGNMQQQRSLLVVSYRHITKSFKQLFWWNKSDKMVQKPKVNVSQGNVATVHRWGGCANNSCDADYFSILYAKYYGTNPQPPSLIPISGLVTISHAAHCPYCMAVSANASQAYCIAGPGSPLNGGSIRQRSVSCVQRQG